MRFKRFLFSGIIVLSMFWCRAQNLQFSQALLFNGINWFHNGTSGSLPSGAIWLPAGATVAGWSQNTNYNILEFTIVP